MLRHLKTFFNISFKIKECEDDVYSSDSSDSEPDDDMAVESKFPRCFIFSCIGVGLTNIARKIE
jgi:hypothetical protein